MLAVNDRVIALGRIVADDGAGDSNDKDTTARDFVHAEIGEAGTVEELIVLDQVSAKALLNTDGNLRAPRLANFRIYWPRTDSLVYVDQGQVTSWDTVLNGDGSVQQYALNAGVVSFQVLPQGDLWALYSTVPVDDYSGSTSSLTNTFPDADTARTATESAIAAAVQVAEATRVAANKKAEADAEAGMVLQQAQVQLLLTQVQLQLAQAQNSLLKVQLENTDLAAQLAAKTDSPK